MYTITVKKLIVLLQSCHSNSKVYIASDEEGNGFGTLNKDSVEQTVGENKNNQEVYIYPVKQFTI